MEGDSRVITAARIAHTFKIDPATILDDSDTFRWAARVAAANVIRREEKKAAEEARNRKQ